MKKDFWIQAFKYGIVGVMNTLLALITFWIMMYGVFHSKKDENVSDTVSIVSNVVGYAVGFINSFFFNRKWTFKSKNHWGKEFIKFFGAFLICYIPQLILVFLLNKYTTGTNLQFALGKHSFIITYSYICQLIGIVFYTTLNFLLNKYYTFKQTSK